MAIRTLIRNGIGMIGKVIQIKTLADAESAFQILTEKINGNISLGNGDNSTQAGNVDGQYIDWTFTAANTEYEIPWSKNRVAIGYDICRRSAAGHVYDSNVGQWSPTSLFLKADTAGLVVKLRVY